jgi:hypothetical protein
MSQALIRKQAAFTQDLAVLVLVAGKLGYFLTYGDAYRDARCKHGHKRSLHKSRLAVDFNLFIENKNGKLIWQKSTKAHKVIGELWEKMGNTWGGRFKDGNHYSKAHGGMK